VTGRRASRGRRDAELRTFLEGQGIGYVLKILCSFRVPLPAGQKMRADHAAWLAPTSCAVADFKCSASLSAG
jgi:hypothetical protein